MTLCFEFSFSVTKTYKHFGSLSLFLYTLPRAICAFEIADTPSSRPRRVRIDQTDLIFTDVFSFKTWKRHRSLRLQFQSANLKRFGGSVSGLVCLTKERSTHPR